MNVNLRPLRFAFLVEPEDRSGILQAIELNTFLWGGTYNPIVPVFRRTPRSWRQDHIEGASAKTVAEGLVQSFDPDYIALTGRYANLTISVGHRKVIRANEIIAGFGENWTPRYGISLFEVVSYFIERELKFVRRSPIDVRVPVFSGRGSLFLASVFGALPAGVQKLFDESFESALEAERTKCALADYPEHLGAGTLFPRRLGSMYLQPPPVSGFHRGDCVFLLDATKPLDIIDYWNLRAVGWSVVPVAIQSAASDSVRRFVKEFIEENFAPYRSNPSLYNQTILLKSRSISEHQLREFGNGLGVEPTPLTAQGKFTYEDRYPRIWDEWARNDDGADPAMPNADTRTVDFSNDTQISLRTLDPEFAYRDSLNSEARFANEVEVRAYGGHDLVAEVIPEGDDSLVTAIGSYDFERWRFSRSCPVYLSPHLDCPIRVSVPEAEKVFVEWLRSRGWEAKLSPPGLTAKQLLKQVQGVWGTAFLSNDHMIKLLGELEGEKTMGLTALRAKLARIANEFGRGSTADGLLARLVENNVMRLGIEVQCPICTQHSWYSVTESDYEILCPKYNERFPLPAHAPKEIGWSYRSVGPFSLPGRASGVYTVLLAYRFFSLLNHRPTTALLSFKAEKAAKSLEADLGLFLKETHQGRTTIELLFAECKTYGLFEKRDIDRMLALSQEFPGAVLVFATLRKKLKYAEKRLLQPLVNRGRRYWKAGRSYNPVLILTATELFSVFRPEESWKRAGGRYAQWAGKFHRNLGLRELCDATQQIYLGMKPWHQWLEERRSVRRSRAV
ncbi:MAG: hypothetical protein ABSH49_22150 [Bryobacteraceae bacterium]